MLIDIYISILEFYNDIIKFFSIIFTVLFDIFNKSYQVIKFNKKNKYIGFMVLQSDTHFNRRAISWFYRNYSIPSINDWNHFIKLFRINYIPSHYIVMFKNNSKDVDIIYIESITNKFIFYSFNNNKCIPIPIKMGTLLPEEYINNYNEYNK